MGVGHGRDRGATRSTCGGPRGGGRFVDVGRSDDASGRRPHEHRCDRSSRTRCAVARSPATPRRRRLRSRRAAARRGSCGDERSAPRLQPRPLRVRGGPLRRSRHAFRGSLACGRREARPTGDVQPRQRSLSPRRRDGRGRVAACGGTAAISGRLDRRARAGTRAAAIGARPLPRRGPVESEGS